MNKLCRPAAGAPGEILHLNEDGLKASRGRIKRNACARYTTSNDQKVERLTLERVDKLFS